MKAVLDLINDVISRPPGEWIERLTPWIFLVLGGIFLLIMAYSYLVAPGSL